MNYGVPINRRMHKGWSSQQPRLDSDELVKAHSRRVASIDNSFREQATLEKIETHWGLCSNMLVNKTQQKELPSAHRNNTEQGLSSQVIYLPDSEFRTGAAEGYDEEVLKHTKYCFLKNEENLTEKQKIKLADVLQYDLKSVRAYLLKESFQLFWNYNSPYWDEWYLNHWCARAIRLRLEPIKDFIRTLRRHQPLIMNWFKAKKQYSQGIVEGLNRKINLVTRKAYGFRSNEVLKIALFHTMGGIPEPEGPHRFC